MDHTWILLITAASLGFRHGIDWDHIAAILDITSATASRDKLQAQHALALSSMYALGHATVVAFLGLCALSFAVVLPGWLDPIMERLVGCTLLFLGGWVLVSLARHFQGKQDFRLRSRWMLLFAHAIQLRDWFSGRLTQQKPSASMAVCQYGLCTSFGVGMIHGIGAETGTQVLLIAAIGGAASHGLGLAMLISFLVGLLISNTLVAVFSTAGFSSSNRVQSLYLTAGAFTCVFSLFVGSYFVAGQAHFLPDLKHLF